MAKINDPVSQNVEGVRQLISSGLNKIPFRAGGNIEGVDGELEDEFTLKLDEQELLRLSRLWINKYATYEAKIKIRQDKNKAYYLGRQNQGGPQATYEESISANLLFEAVETFLPAALSKNPEPVVWADNTEEGNAVSDVVKTMLQYHADTQVLRRKLSLVVRHWTTYFIGAMKHGWDAKIGDIKSEIVDPRNFIFDPEASIDSYGDYDGAYLGERITCTAQRLADLFPKHRAYITIMVDGKMGTDVIYTQWWNDDYCFYTFKDKVLDKHKNPNFNYPKKEEGEDQDGQSVVTEKKGRNHFAIPKKPYTFLAVFTLGEQPHDITSLIEQNIPNQNLVTKRTNQIDKNLDRANNSIGLSENNFNQETAKQAATAMQEGRPVLIPGGNISEAIARFPAPSYPEAAFRQLEVSKQDLRSIFGTEGISSQKPNEDTTARGMILNQQFDNTRIGGGVGDALAQFADNVFNWWVQLYYVYYDDQHFASIMGQMKAVEYVQLTSADLDRQIVVSVSADSMKPHDELTEMNQAMSLWSAGALDPKTLLTMLNVPDPQKTAEMTVLWLLDKSSYLQLNFPDLASQLQQIQQQNAQAAMQQQTMTGQPTAGGLQGGTAESPPPSTGEPLASASLSNVPLPQ